MMDQASSLEAGELDTAANLALTLTTLESQQAVAEAVCSWLVRELAIPFARIMVLDTDRSRFATVGTAGWPEGAAGELTVENDVATEPGYTLALGQPLTWHHAQAERRFQLPTLYRDHGITAGLSVPLRRQAEYFGTLVLHRTDGADWPRAAAPMANLAVGLAAGFLTAHALETAYTALDAERERLWASNNIKTAALNTLSELVVITDVQGYVTYVNPAFERETGFPADEVVGTRFAFLKSQRSAPDVYHEIWETLVEGRPWSGRVVNDRKHGPDYLEEQTITPVHGEHGQIEHLVAIKRVIESTVPA